MSGLLAAFLPSKTRVSRVWMRCMSLWVLRPKTLAIPDPIRKKIERKLLGLSLGNWCNISSISSILSARWSIVSFFNAYKFSTNPLKWAVWNKSGSSRSEANRRKTRLKFHGVVVFLRSQEADIYSKIATRHTINDKYSKSLVLVFLAEYLCKKRI